jgi:phosphatidylglycerophosphatase A
MGSAPLTGERKYGWRAGGAWLVSTALGAGRSPLAPGTAGSLVGVATFWAIHGLPLVGQLAFTAGLFGLGVYCSARTAVEVGQKDPSVVVVDEVVGQWVALLVLPFTPGIAALSFVLFRVMDVFKPWPARDLERLPGGFGIMADDLMAGAYANLLVRVVLTVVPLS